MESICQKMKEIGKKDLCGLPVIFIRNMFHLKYIIASLNVLQAIIKSIKIVNDVKNIDVKNIDEEWI